MDVYVYNPQCIVYEGMFSVSFLSPIIPPHSISALFPITVISQFLFSSKFPTPSSSSLSQMLSASLISPPISISKQCP